MRVWSRSAKSGEIGLVAVDAERVIWSWIGAEEAKAAADKIASGTSAAAALGTSGYGAGFEIVSRVRSDKRKGTLGLTIGRGKKARTVSLDFGEDQTMRDEVFREIESRSGWRRKETTLNAFTAAVRPLLFMILVGGIGYMFRMLAFESELGYLSEPDGRRRMFVKVVIWFAELLGPTGSVVAAAVVMSFLAV